MTNEIDGASTRQISFTFFGTSEFSVYVLDALKEKGFLPAHIVTTIDKPQGRKLVITPPPVKLWAIKNNILYIQPENLKDDSAAKSGGAEKLIAELNSYKSDVFIVASYGKIIPQMILDIPAHKTLNVHPSLLPKLRGATPIQTAILEENSTGVTIIRIDEKMDHGPIVAQKEIAVENWSPTSPPRYEDLEKILGVAGGHVLAEILPDWINGKIAEKEQDHALATFTKKIEKADGHISLDDDAQKNLRKIRAFSKWPTAYFFAKKSGDAENGPETKDIRVIITDAEITDGALQIKKVIPEGKKEMDYPSFLNFLKG